MSKVIIFVQGEGRGHMTQALSAIATLKKHQHEIQAVFVGKSLGRTIPSYFFSSIDAPLYPFSSPNFIKRNNREISLRATLTKNLKVYKRYLKAFRVISKKIDYYQPDLILNFFDPMIGLYFKIKNPSIPFICLGHQYLLLHPKFKFPDNSWLNRTLLKQFSKLTSSNCYRRLALSFYPLESDAYSKLSVVPPLLRPDLYQMQSIAGDDILVYVTNTGYLPDIKKWSTRYPNLTLNCFGDFNQNQFKEFSSGNMILHEINAKSFMKHMLSCKALVTTAGFESVCEAGILGKPVLAIPVEGHYEQKCNAMDAQNACIAIANETFNLSSLFDFITRYDENAQDNFKKWCQQAEYHLIREINYALEDRIIIGIPSAII